MALSGEGCVLRESAPNALGAGTVSYELPYGVLEPPAAGADGFEAASAVCEVHGRARSGREGPG
ncbi:hypothetical protein [Streptomyces erythrochromogenes]|uniref:hypothetical protein n=1 Tax=Streptomyces erythrochromogenes TaxID=285574 RepID=UPI003814DEEC